MQNVLSIDVEDYYQVAALAESIKYDDWDKKDSRVVKNTTRLLDIFDEYNIKATHFILGWVAERNPELVKEIHNRGHEVASHGYSHQLIYNQTPDVFRQETERSKKLLEDITGVQVLGYRAASYSITRKSLWALDILAETGFKYDSSIFPIRHDRYGINGSPHEPHNLITPSGYKLIEYPLSTMSFMKQSIPIAGGGYFRLYPYWLSRLFYLIRKRQNNPFVFYLHPWEIDPNQPKVEVSWFSKFRHYNNLDKCESRLKSLIKDFEFSTMKNKLQDLGFFTQDYQPQANYQ